MNSSSTSLAALTFFLSLRRHLISSLIIQDCQTQGSLIKGPLTEGIWNVFLKLKSLYFTFQMPFAFPSFLYL